MMDETRSMQQSLSRRRFALLTLAFPVVVAACQTPGSGPAPRRVRLSPATEFAPNLPSVGWALKVQEPNATLSLNTALIGYMKREGEIEYLSGAEWASRAPEMVMELITKSFENSNMILTVGDRRSRVRPNFELEMELRRFQFIETAEDKGTATVGLTARMIQHPRRNAVGSFPFDSTTDVEGIEIDSIVAGFDEALQDVMSQLVEWTLRTGSGVS